MANELAILRRQSAINKGALEDMRKEMDTAKEERAKTNKKYKSGRNCCLELKKNGKNTVEELNASLAEEKSAQAESLKYHKLMLSEHNNNSMKALRHAKLSSLVFDTCSIAIIAVILAMSLHILHISVK
ncbi:hypothetical protein LR48_Vigan02g073200 [Vigna angularis]|uniref:Uncharacterized protein n=1 Tax=Phaseolus angularis TaxID=3914 RepID=A0A0L9TW05_PHAAN|nr:hypothetical protein LR48_Vigan02g073200 [Vigna angularis]